MKKIYSILIVTSLLFVVGLLAGCSGVKQADYDAAKAQVTALQGQLNTANTALDAANAAKSQVEANKAFVSHYYDIVNLPDMKGYEDLLAPDFKRYVSDNAAPLNGDANKKRMLGFHAVFPDFKLTLKEIVAEGDLVAAHMTFTGTQNGPFLGIPPTGKLITIWSVEVFRIENGKVAEMWGGPDIFNGLQQLGAVISAGK